MGDSNTPHLLMDTGSKLTINKESMALRDAPVSTRRCRTFHPETAASAVLSSAHGTFSRVDHTLGHNPSLNKLQEMDIIPRIFSQHDATERQMNPKSNLESPRIHGSSITCYPTSTGSTRNPKRMSKITWKQKDTPRVPNLADTAPGNLRRQDPAPQEKSPIPSADT